MLEFLGHHNNEKLRVSTLRRLWKNIEPKCVYQKMVLKKRHVLTVFPFQLAIRGMKQFHKIPCGMWWH